MKTQLENDTLTLYLDGRIDSNNAPAVEEEFQTAVESAPEATVVLDAEKLEYISSAGLRVLMKLKKRKKGPLPMVNVSPEVYDILEVTGFTQLLKVQKKLREVSVEGCALLGEGANGKVYRFTPDEMIKVFRPGITLEEIEQEREASRKAFLLGVPCAIPFDTVRCGESYGTIYELLKAKTLTERIRDNPEDLPRYAESSARILKQLHEIQVPEGQMPAADCLLHHTLDAVAGDFTPQEVEQMHRLYRAIPAQNYFVHNDYHAKNVMESGGELILIDLGDAGAGNPLIDMIHCYMVYNLIGESQRKDDKNTISFIGLTYGEMDRFWEIFSNTYWGSEGEARRMDKVMEPFARLMYFTTSMSHPILPKEYHAVYADKVRSLVLPRAGEMLSAFEE